MDFRQIGYFLSIYDAGNLTKASQNERVAQPALSVQLRRLEQELGVLLFERRPHGVVPTVAGKRFYKLCQPIVTDVAHARAEMAAFSTELSGRMTIGLPSALDRSVLGLFLPKFAALYPNIEVTIREGFSGTLAEWTHDGTVDFAIATRPQDEAGLALRLLHSEPLVLASHRPDFGPMLQPVDLQNVGSIKLVVPLPHHPISRQVTDYLRDLGIVVDRIMYIDGYVATIEMISNSQDWSTITALSVLFPEIGAKSVPVHPIAGNPLTFSLYLMHRLREPISPLACEFLRMLETAFAEFTERYTALFAPWRREADHTGGNREAERPRGEKRLRDRRAPAGLP